MTTHNWKCEGSVWTCATCGHSFTVSGKKGPITQFDADGAPARSDPTWFEFHIVGLMSFIDAGKGMDEKTRRKFVALMGMNSDAAAFEHCLLAQEMDNYVLVDAVMSE